MLLIGGLYPGQFTIMTEEYPPYNFTKDGELQGISVDIVKELIKGLGYQYDYIEVYPWARAYKALQVLPKSILFSMIRTEERSKLFKFACPLLTDRFYFYTRKHGASSAIHSIQEAKELKTIATVRNWRRHQWLEEQGFTNLHIASHGNTQFELLKIGRAEAIIASPIEIVSNDAASYSVNTGIETFTSEYCIAFSDDVPDQEVLRWESALRSFRKTPKYESILKNYLSMNVVKALKMVTSQKK